MVGTLTWWDALEENFDDMVSLTIKFHPFYGENHRYTITASRAEEVCQTVRKTIKKENAYEHLTPAETLQLAKANRQGATIHRLLNEVWFGMPESSSVRCEPGFGVLCDLCSEYEGE